MVWGNITDLIRSATKEIHVELKPASVRKVTSPANKNRRKLIFLGLNLVFGLPKHKRAKFFKISSWNTVSQRKGGEIFETIYFFC